MVSTKGKSELVTKFAGIIVTIIFSYKKVSQIIFEIFAT